MSSPTSMLSFMRSISPPVNHMSNGPGAGSPSPEPQQVPTPVLFSPAASRKRNGNELRAKVEPDDCQHQAKKARVDSAFARAVPPPVYLRPSQPSVEPPALEIPQQAPAPFVFELNASAAPAATSDTDDDAMGVPAPAPFTLDLSSSSASASSASSASSAAASEDSDETMGIPQQPASQAFSFPPDVEFSVLSLASNFSLNFKV